MELSDQIDKAISKINDKFKDYAINAYSGAISTPKGLIFNEALVQIDDSFDLIYNIELESSSTKTDDKTLRQTVDYKLKCAIAFKLKSFEEWEAYQLSLDIESCFNMIFYNLGVYKEFSQYAFDVNFKNDWGIEKNSDKYPYNWGAVTMSMKIDNVEQLNKCRLC